MTVNDTESLGANAFSETRSVFSCSKSAPHLVWDLNRTTSLKIVLAVTIIACPVIVLLNLLVILAVKTRKELQKNSNILLSSLAVADVLVGAVSIPLTITLNGLVLQRILFEDLICTIGITSDFVLYTTYGVSLLHLLVIAWERHVAVVKWMKYKVIVTRHRVKKYAIVAWLSALIILVAPVTIMAIVVVRYEIILVVYVIHGIFWVVFISLLTYFYIKAYFGVRKWNKTQTHTLPVNALVRAKLERKIAYTTFWLTLFIVISGFPSIVVYSFHSSGRVSSFFHEASFFRWAETILQLNSLANPLLYFYRNRQLRKAALELLKCRKPQRIQPVARTLRRNRRRRYSMASQNFEELQMTQIEQNRPRFVRSEPCFSAVMCSDTAQPRSDETEGQRERPIKAPSRICTQEPNKLVVTVQIERAPSSLQRNTEFSDTAELEPRSGHHYGTTGKIVRTTSLNENSFATLRSCHQNAAEKSFSRSRSLPMYTPMLLTKFNASDNKLTVDELEPRSRHLTAGKIVRSTSLKENSFATLRNCHHNAAEKNFSRSRSLPML